MIQVLVGGAAVYGLLVGGLYFLQDGMLFPRAVAVDPTYPLPRTAETLTIDTPAGARITGRYVRARTAKSRGLLIGFAGNAWNADDFAVFMTQRVHDFDIVVFHYRGYAPSQGEPSERALCQDALLIYDLMIERLQPDAVYAAGFSLGSGVAAFLASKRHLDGLLLVTPFDSIEAVAKQRYPWAPVGTLLKHAFHSDRHLKDRDVPAAVITASHDRIVPKERSLALVNVLKRPVLVQTVAESTHNTIYDQESFDEVLLQALDALEAASRDPAPSKEAQAALSGASAA